MPGEELGKFAFSHLTCAVGYNQVFWLLTTVNAVDLGVKVATNVGLGIIAICNLEQNKQQGLMEGKQKNQNNKLKVWVFDKQFQV